MTMMVDEISLTNKGRSATEGLTCDKKTFTRRNIHSAEIYTGFYSTKRIPSRRNMMLVHHRVAP